MLCLRKRPVQEWNVLLEEGWNYQLTIELKLLNTKNNARSCDLCLWLLFGVMATLWYRHNLLLSYIYICFKSVNTLYPQVFSQYNARGKKIPDICSRWHDYIHCSIVLACSVRLATTETSCWSLTIEIWTILQYRCLCDQALYSRWPVITQSVQYRVRCVSC